MKFTKSLTTMGVLSFAAMPSSAAAFDFGFVRVPDYMDTPILILFIVSIVFIALIKILGYSDDGTGKRKRQPGLFGKAVIGIGGLAFFALMGMVFVGMGLVRYAEATV